MSLKFKLVSAILLLVSMVSWGQDKNPLDDAIKYNDYMKSSKPKEAAAILKKYSNTYSDLQSNHFITTSNSSVSDSLLETEFNTATARGVSIGKAQSTSVGISGQFIDAIAGVVADGFREELTLAFLDDFRQKLEEDKYLKELFPNAYKVLAYEDPFMYKSWMANFRSALESDIQELPDHIHFLIDAIVQDTDMSPDRKKQILTANKIYPEFINIWKEPNASNETVQNILTVLKDSVANPSLQKNIELVDLIVKELADGEGWITKSKLDKLYKSGKFDEAVLSTFIGFIIEKYKSELGAIQVNVLGLGQSDVYSVTHAGTGNVNEQKLELLIKQIILGVKDINSAIATIKTAQQLGGKVTYADFDPLLSSVLDLMDVLTGDDALFLTDASGIADKKKIIKILKNVNSGVSFAESLKKAVEESDYSAAINATVELLEEVIDNNEALASNLFLKEFLKYGNLAANLAQAQTSEEIKSVLKASILPAQSYRLKRNTYFSVSVNSYAGGYAGLELLNNKMVKNEMSGLLAFTAPVGIGFNWGLKGDVASPKVTQHHVKTIINEDGTIERKKFFNGSSFSLFVSVIDVGGLVAYRLKDDQTPVGTIPWSNVIAPGVYGCIGLGNTPLSLNLGVQYGPMLRSVEAVDGALEPVVEASGLRIGGALVVDIPFYTLYSREEKVVNKLAEAQAEDKKDLAKLETKNESLERKIAVKEAKNKSSVDKLKEKQQKLQAEILQKRN